MTKTLLHQVSSNLSSEAIIFLEQYFFIMKRRLGVVVVYTSQSFLLASFSSKFGKIYKQSNISVSVFQDISFKTLILNEHYAKMHTVQCSCLQLKYNNVLVIFTNLIQVSYHTTFLERGFFYM